MTILSIEILEEIEKLDPPLRRTLLKILKGIESYLEKTVRREDFQRLTSIVGDIAEEVKKIAEEQKKLSEAQRKTEEELKKLVNEHEKTRKDLGGLTQSFGYFLENESYRYLPALLEKDYHLQLFEPLDRKFIKYPNNRYDEINIFGSGRLNGKEVVILGEVKSQLSKKHVDEFLKKVSRIKKFYAWETFLVLVTHMPVNPHVEDYVRDLGIALYKSSQFR